MSISHYSVKVAAFCSDLQRPDIANLLLYVTIPIRLTRVETCTGNRNMNKLIRSVLLAAASLLVSHTASAQVYAGIGAGKTSWSLNCTSTCSASKPDVHLTLGYDLGQEWSVEGRFSKLSDVTETTRQWRFRSYQTEVAGLRRFMVQNNLVTFGKFGVTYTRFSPQETNGATVEKSNRFSPMVGVGLAYKITNLVAVRGEIETRQIRFMEQNSKITSVSFGIQKAF